MKNKKTLILLAITVIMTFFNTCFAISEEDLILDKISINDTISEIKTIYGEPESKEPLMPKGTKYVFSYNNNKIYVLEGPQKIIYTKENSTIATSKGITCGTTAESVKYVYGKPNYEEAGKIMFYTNRKQTTGNNGRPETIIQQLTFKLNNENKVQEISIEQYVDDETI